MLGGLIKFNKLGCFINFTTNNRTGDLAKRLLRVFRYCTRNGEVQKIINPLSRAGNVPPFTHLRKVQRQIVREYGVLQARAT